MAFAQRGSHSSSSSSSPYHGISARAQVCGDNETQGDETCDDGNTVGGDGCAANCTGEHRVSVTIRAGSHFNAQGRLGQAYGSPGLPLSGGLTLAVGARRASDSAGVVPFVIRAQDAQIDPVPLAGTACFCARPTVPASFPSGIVAQGTLGCGAAGLTEADYDLSQDHNILDVDPECAAGTLQPDGHCTGPLQRHFTGAVRAARRRRRSASRSTSSATATRRPRIPTNRDARTTIRCRFRPSICC